MGQAGGRIVAHKALNVPIVIQAGTQFNQSRPGILPIDHVSESVNGRSGIASGGITGGGYAVAEPQFLRASDKYGRVKQHGVVIIYYRCHGLVDDHGSGNGGTAASPDAQPVTSVGRGPELYRLEAGPGKVRQSAGRITDSHGEVRRASGSDGLIIFAAVVVDPLAQESAGFGPSHQHAGEVAGFGGDDVHRGKRNFREQDGAQVQIGIADLHLSGNGCVAFLGGCVGIILAAINTGDGKITASAGGHGVIFIAGERYGGSGQAGQGIVAPHDPSGKRYHRHLLQVKVQSGRLIFHD